MQAHVGHIAEKVEKSDTADKGAVVAQSEYATLRFAATINGNLSGRGEDKGMKMTPTVTSGLIGVTQSQWVRPTLMTVLLVVVVLGMTGCPIHH